MVFDDGWDDPKTLWQFHDGFPDGFTPLAKLCRQYHTQLGVWLSPFGGYGEPRKQRLKYRPPAGLRDQCHRVLAGGSQVLRGVQTGLRRHDSQVRCESLQVRRHRHGDVGAAEAASYVRDTEAMRRLMLELRQEDPDLYINLTTGSWPSPFWLRYADSVWRQGGDMGLAGESAPSSSSG